MQIAQLGHDSPIRFQKDEADLIRIENLQARPRLEVHNHPKAVGLVVLFDFFPGELDDLGIKHFAIMKFHPSTECHFQGAVVEPAPARRQARD